MVLPAPDGAIDITILGDTTGFVTGVPPDGLPNEATGDLDADVDFSNPNWTFLFESWDISADPGIGTATIDPDTGEWLYEVDPAEFANLDAGEFVEDTFEVEVRVVAFNPGGQLQDEFQTQTVIIGIEGVCFAGGTLITTDKGDVPIEALVKGDLVLTRDHGFQPIRWIESNRLSLARLLSAPNLWPVRLEPGALGLNCPRRALFVTQQHRLMVAGPQVEVLFGVHEALVAAKSLCHWPGIGIDPPDAEIEYFHLLFERHEIINAEGAPAESLFLGEEALVAMTSEGLQELAEIFPASVLQEVESFGSAARMILKHTEASALS